MGDSNEKRVYLLSLGSTVCFPGECTRVSIPNGLFYDYVQRYCDTQLPSLLTVLPELEPLLALVHYGTQEPLIVHARVDPRAEHSDRPALCAVATACEVLHEDISSAATASTFAVRGVRRVRIHDYFQRSEYGLVFVHATALDDRLGTSNSSSVAALDERKRHRLAHFGTSLCDELSVAALAARVAALAGIDAKDAAEQADAGAVFCAALRRARVSLAAQQRLLEQASMGERLLLLLRLLERLRCADDVGLCRACGETLVVGREREPGATFGNRYGAVHQVLVYREARNVVLDAEPPTLEDTWFEGMAWQIMYCARCHAHAGWRFTSTDDGPPRCFFGVTARSVQFGVDEQDVVRPAVPQYPPARLVPRPA